MNFFEKIIAMFKKKGNSQSRIITNRPKVLAVKEPALEEREPPGEGEIVYSYNGKEGK